MEYPELYLDWIDYLHEKKLYGTWKNDLSLCAYACENAPNPRRYIFGLCGKSDYIDTIINSFGVANDKGLRYVIDRIARDLKWTIAYYSSSKIDWFQIYHNFYTLRHPPITLSRKLSRKLYRSNNKISSSYHPREKEEQPWYNKSYEKNKYNKKAWRK
jgi:hypothetical protein